MTIDTHIGCDETETDVRVYFDHFPAEGDGFHNPHVHAEIIINEVIDLNHLASTGYRSDVQVHMDDDDEERILGLCWDAVKERQQEQASAFEATREDQP